MTARHTYPADPGGVFESDAHRRVLGHLSRPDDDYGWTIEALAYRMAGDYSLVGADLAHILADLAQPRLAESFNGAWRMTAAGFKLLTVPDEPRARTSSPADPPEGASPIPPPFPSLPPPSRQSHAFLALNEQKQRGEKLRDTGDYDMSQKYTALIRMATPPQTFADKVSAWVGEVAAMVEVHTNLERTRFFLSDDGLPGGAEPEVVLARRLHRLEEIIRKLPAGASP